MRSKIEVLVGKWGFPGIMVENWGFGGKMRFSGVLVEKWGFYGKIGVFLKNGVFVGFWSRNRGKVGKGREFDDFWKIGKNREK